jgi:hypothetical protein
VQVRNKEHFGELLIGYSTNGIKFLHGFLANNTGFKPRKTNICEVERIIDKTA